MAKGGKTDLLKLWPKPIHHSEAVPYEAPSSVTGEMVQKIGGRQIWPEFPMSLQHLNQLMVRLHAELFDQYRSYQLIELMKHDGALTLLIKTNGKNKLVYQWDEHARVWEKVAWETKS